MKNNNEKYIKIKKGKLQNCKLKSNKLQFGEIGLKALESGTITHKQILGFIQILCLKTKYRVKIWKKKLYSVGVTRKPIGIKMGKGCGKIFHSLLKITCGSIFLEFSSFNDRNLINIINSCKFKFSIKTKVIKIS